MSEAPDCVGAFIEAACVPLDADHASGTIDDVDGIGRGPLLHARKACVESYWTHRRAADSAALLLSAGASVSGVPYPSGFSEVDALLESHGASRT
jgi:hypothetical protein